MWSGPGKQGSPRTLHARLREQGEPVGLTTVYRHLPALAETGQVDVVHTTDGQNLYRRCATDSHHHHLVCRTCGHTIEVEGPEIETWTEHVAAAQGFANITHVVEIYGTCPSCA